VSSGQSITIAFRHIHETVVKLLPYKDLLKTFPLNNLKAIWLMTSLFRKKVVKNIPVYTQTYIFTCLVF